MCCFMDVIMGDIPLYNLTTLCLNGTPPCVDFIDVIMGDIPSGSDSSDVYFPSAWLTKLIKAN